MDTLYHAPHRAPPVTICEAPALSSLCRYIGFEPAESWLFSRDPTETLGRTSVDHAHRCISTSMFPRRPGPLSLNELVAWRKEFLLVPTGRISSREGGFMIGTVLGDATSGVFGIGKAEAVIRFAVSEERGDALFISWVRDNAGDVGRGKWSGRKRRVEVENEGEEEEGLLRYEEDWRYAVVTYVTVVDLCHRQREMILFDLKEGGGVHLTRAKQRIATIEVRDCPLCHSAAGVCFCSKLKNVMLPPRTYMESNVEIRHLQRTDTINEYRRNGDDQHMPFANAGLPRLYALLSGVYQGNVQMFEFDRKKKGEMIKSFSTHVVSSGELGDDTMKLKRRLVSDFVRDNYNPARDAGLGHTMIRNMMDVLNGQNVEEERRRANRPNKSDIDFLLNKPQEDPYGPIYHSPVGISEIPNPHVPPGLPTDAGPSSGVRGIQPRRDRVVGPVLDRITKDKLRVLRNRERAQISNEKRRARLKSMELQLSNSKATVNLLLEMTIALHKENDRLRQHIESGGLAPVDTQSSFDLVVQSDEPSERPREDPQARK